MLTQELAKAAPPKLRSPAGISPNLARLAEEAGLGLEIPPDGAWTGHALGPADSAAAAKALLHGLAEQPGGDAAVERPLAAYRDDTLTSASSPCRWRPASCTWRSCPASTSGWAGSA